ncbi:MAG: S8 family serine peptidase [Spirochaetaceae bacterium]|nr:S8 family serine peptidase [Spirochaetaceae bacterium]
MTVAIIDSGIDIHHPSLEGVPFLGGVSFCQRGGEVEVGDDYDDQIGHGTAVASIVAQKSSVRILSVKVFHSDMECTEDVLIAALSYLEGRGDCDIVNVSAGLTGLQRRDDMESICDNLAAMSCYIVAAFNNTGVISYPPGLFVLGLKSWLN